MIYSAGGHLTALLATIGGAHEFDVGDHLPLEQSRKLADKLKAAGVEVTLGVVDGGGHGDAEFWTMERMKRLAEFLNRHLRR